MSERSRGILDLVKPTTLAAKLRDWSRGCPLLLIFAPIRDCHQTALVKAAPARRMRIVSCPSPNAPLVKAAPARRMRAVSCLSPNGNAPGFVVDGSRPAVDVVSVPACVTRFTPRTTPDRDRPST
jgi:hypothetical protein